MRVVIFHLMVSLCLSLSSLSTARADQVLIRGAEIYQSYKLGVKTDIDLLITDGKVAALGRNLQAPANAHIIEAQGKVITPGLFGGLSGIGLEEIGLESSTVDTTWDQQDMRPEFLVTQAFNPHSSIVPITRIEGITHTLLKPDRGSSIILGQGNVVALHGGFTANLSSPILFIDLGADASGASGSSRAAQFMLLQQAIDETKSKPDFSSKHSLLTPAGRSALKALIKGSAKVVFDVDRAADIMQVISFARRNNIQAVILGGAEAWIVRRQLSAAEIPVVLDPLVNAPGNFDRIGARLDNAALLAQAGVKIAFTRSSDTTHNARKVRQAAGNAVANGLRWATAVAALTEFPADIFGYSDQAGTITLGKAADLVVWSGDPLEVTSSAEAVFIQGRQIPMESRQTLMLKRYLPQNPAQPRAYIKPD